MAEAFLGSGTVSIEACFPKSKRLDLNQIAAAIVNQTAKQTETLPAKNPAACGARQARRIEGR
jgi:hypothetical protein